MQDRAQMNPRRGVASSPTPIVPEGQSCAWQRQRHPAMFKNALVLSLLLGAALCKPLHKRWDDFKVKHAWVDGVPKGWEAIGPAPSDHRLAVRIGMKQDGIYDLIAHLYAVSDPNHHR